MHQLLQNVGFRHLDGTIFHSNLFTPLLYLLDYTYDFTQIKRLQQISNGSYIQCRFHVIECIMPSQKYKLNPVITFINLFSQINSVHHWHLDIS
ncbi:hypothetical protein D3C77_391820 [compost metagenome]